MTFLFASGADSTWASQDTFGATFRIPADSGLLKYLDFGAYTSTAHGKNLGTKAYTVDSATFLRLFSDSRLIQGGTTTGISATVGVQLGANDAIDFRLGANRSNIGTL